MRLTVAAPGRLNHPGTVALSDDYIKRIARIMPIHRISGRSSRRDKGGRDQRALLKESEELLRKIPSGAAVVALDIGGKKYDSNAFLLWLVGLIEGGAREVVFVVGGPDGLSAEILEASRYRMSLSPMTLPHELAEVVLLEQLYRALTRWKGLPYHR